MRRYLLFFFKKIGRGASVSAGWRAGGREGRDRLPAVPDHRRHPVAGRGAALRGRRGVRGAAAGLRRHPRRQGQHARARRRHQRHQPAPRVRARARAVLHYCNNQTFRTRDTTTFFIMCRSTRNPYNASKVAGDSSSGSAAVVCAGLCPVALGVDGGGACRQTISSASSTTN